MCFRIVSIGFGCACPANVARLIASVDRYVYTERDGGRTVLAHQFIANQASLIPGCMWSSVPIFRGTVILSTWWNCPLRRLIRQFTFRRAYSHMVG